MKCIKCGNDLPDGAKFCTKCGEKVLPQTNNVCVNCGAQLKPGAKFCVACGTPVGAPSVQLANEKMASEPMKQQPNVHQSNEHMNMQADMQQNYQQKAETYGNTSGGSSISGGIIAAIIAIVVLVILIIVLCVKIFILDSDDTKQGKDAVSTEVTEQTDSDNESNGDSSNSENAGENSVDLFKEIPSNFCYSSGVGAWSTDITIASDGTFTGSYHDSNMGESGAGYPNGTVYQCNFNGKFVNPKEVVDGIYTMELEYLNTDGTLNEEKIIDGVKYITSEPYGFESGKTYEIYMIGTKKSDLPENFIYDTEWMGSSGASYLEYYGLYNVEAQHGFFGEDESSASNKNTSTDSYGLSNDYIIPDSNTRYLTDADLAGLSLQQLNYAKNEIYARHGYIFESKELQAYFGSKSWYTPLYKKSDFDRLGLLSKLETQNASKLSAREKALGTYQLDK